MALTAKADHPKTALRFRLSWASLRSPQPMCFTLTVDQAGDCADRADAGCRPRY